MCLNYYVLVKLIIYADKYLKKKFKKNYYKNK